MIDCNKTVLFPTLNRVNISAEKFMHNRVYSIIDTVIDNAYK